MEKTEKTAMENFVLCLENNPDHAYDMILEESQNFSKEELSRISAELLYGIHSMRRNWTISRTEEKDFYDSVAEELADTYDVFSDLEEE